MVEADVTGRFVNAFHLEVHTVEADVTGRFVNAFHLDSRGTYGRS